LRRRQFGKPASLLLDYQAHQKRLLPRLAQAYAVTAALQEIRQEYLSTLSQQKPAGRPLETRIAALKSYCSWTALEAVQVCRESCGGAGYMAEGRLGAMRADLDVFTTFEGDNTVLGLLVARNLLAELREESQGSTGLAAGRLLQSRWSKAGSLLLGANTAEALRSPEFQGAAFRLRRERLTASLAQRIARRTKDGHSLAEAFNQCQDHALALASAYARECVYEAFARQVQSSRPAFAILRDLFALWTLEGEAAFYLEKGLLGGSQLSTIRGLVLSLSAEVRGDARGLVDRFDIPDRLLGAPALLEPLA
jgi:acyl-CoA oxidase